MIVATAAIIVVASLSVRACMLHGLPELMVYALVSKPIRLGLYVVMPLLALVHPPLAVVGCVLLVMLDRHVHKMIGHEKHAPSHGAAA